MKVVNLKDIASTTVSRERLDLFQNFSGRYPFFAKNGIVANVSLDYDSSAVGNYVVFINHNLRLVPPVLVWRRDADGGDYSDSSRVSPVPYHEVEAGLVARKIGFIVNDQSVTIIRTEYAASGSGIATEWFKLVILPGVLNA